MPFRDTKGNVGWGLHVQSLLTDDRPQDSFVSDSTMTTQSHANILLPVTLNR